MANLDTAKDQTCPNCGALGEVLQPFFNGLGCFRPKQNDIWYNVDGSGQCCQCYVKE